MGDPLPSKRDGRQLLDGDLKQHKEHDVSRKVLSRPSKRRVNLTQQFQADMTRDDVQAGRWRDDELTTAVALRKYIPPRIGEICIQGGGGGRLTIQIWMPSSFNNMSATAGRLQPMTIAIFAPSR